MEVHVIRYLLFIFYCFSVLESQSNTGYDLVSDLESNNKMLYTRIGLVQSMETYRAMNTVFGMF